MRYKFCPQCGSELTARTAGDEGSVPYCERCQKFWFDSFGSCSIVMVVNELGEIALLSQNYLSDRYKTFVSGYITPGETAEETAFREVNEELGIQLERLEYAGTHWFAQKELLMHGFIGYVKKRAFHLSQEVDDAQWVPSEQVADLIFPDAPGNAAFAIYKEYCKKNK